MYVRIFLKKNNKIESTRKIQSEQSIPVNYRIIVLRTARNYHGIHEVLFKGSIPGSIIYVIVVYFYYYVLWILAHGTVLQVCFHG